MPVKKRRHKTIAGMCPEQPIPTTSRGKSGNRFSGKEILEQAALAVESLFVEMQGHAPHELYEDGYSDAISSAASVIRMRKFV